MFETFTKDFMILWTTIDPIAALVVYAALTANKPEAERRRVARKSVLYAGIVLLSSIIVGQLILSAMGIALESFQIAGGIILFILGLKMVFSSSFDEKTGQAETGHDIAVFPLAMPFIASPGAMLAVIILTDNNLYTVTHQLAVGATMGIILALTYGGMIVSGRIMSRIGTNGAMIIIKVMGVLLAALSVELVMDALNLQKFISAS